MITLPSTGVLLVIAAVLLVLMLCQWFIGGITRRDLRGRTPESRRESSARVSFHRAA
jgi:hypothetical protein